MSFVLTAIYQVRLGEEAAVESHLKAMVGPTRDEEACEQYEAFRSRDGSRTFFLFEKYTDESGFEFHKASEHFKKHIIKGVWPLLESRNVVFGEEIGA